MPFVSSDGTVVQERPRHPLARAFSNMASAVDGLTLVKKAVLGAILVLAYRQWWFYSNNPLANGRIPAASVPPDQHWARLANDDSLVRTMVQHIGRQHHTAGNRKIMDHYTQTGNLEMLMGHVDFGGPDDHVFERVDLRDPEAFRGTRCASTQSALTAYFCGAQVAENLDMGLGDEERKVSFPGIQSFVDYISCQHEKGEANNNGNHRRSVYRIGVGTEDPLAGFSHAFNIIAMPDGTFYWLQSFISHYSLRTWMERTDTFGKPLGKLTLAQLLDKMRMLAKLMSISEWTPVANSYYLDLFGVDKDQEARHKGHGSTQLTWKPSHRLSSFYWDEACEFPIQESKQEQNSNEEAKSEKESAYHWDDCAVAAWGNALKDSLLVKQ